MTATAKTAATFATTVYVERVPALDGEPDHSPRWEVEIRAIHDRHTGDLVAVDANVVSGLGIGPHRSRSSRRLRRFAWALMHAADAMDAAMDPPPLPALEMDPLPFPEPNRRHR